MKISRFLLPFTLGAIAVLVVMIAGERAAPGVLGRVGNAMQPGLPVPGASANPSPSGTEAVAPDTQASRRTGGSAREVPGVPTASLPDLSGGAGALGLLIPVQGVEAASLVDTYRQARGQGRRHDAIDIMAPRGTPVLAVADGVVMKLFRSARGGITLYELAPDRRTIYYYAHLDGYAPGMAEGRALRRGQVLGYVGNTGDAGPGNYHLHFEVSTTADPAKVLGWSSGEPVSAATLVPGHASDAEAKKRGAEAG